MHEEHSALYDWLLFGHIVAAMVWLGGLLTLIVFGIAAGQSDDSAAVPRFFGNVRMVAPWVFGASTFFVLALGSWMVFESDEWSLAQTWVWLGVVLFAAAIVVGALIAGRANKRAERATADGDRTEARRQLSRWTLGMGLVSLVLVAAVWDMVFRPGV